MNKTYLFVIGLLSLTPFHTACADSECSIEFPRAGLCASYSWIVEPATDQEAKMLLKFWDKASSKPTGPYVDPAEKLGLEPFMDMGGGHGHGSAPTRYTRKEAGVYEFRRIFLVMLGDWQLKFQRRDQQNRVLEEAVTTYRVTH